MDWNLILFVSKWATIGVFYSVLLFLLFGVYREMTGSMRKVKTANTITYGRLYVRNAGDDKHIRVGAIFDLKTETRLGADTDNDVVLRDSYVSGHHAVLRWDGVTWWVEDLRSRNGTMVNDQPCEPGLPQPLANGSVLTLGEMEFVLIDQDAE
ncbi:MAG: FHA domain-containing protein [Chloroflexi bacterium]|nr:FHA domain-containing protein [Chloroflexota bacterium]